MEMRRLEGFGPGKNRLDLNSLLPGDDFQPKILLVDARLQLPTANTVELIFGEAQVLSDPVAPSGVLLEKMTGMTAGQILGQPIFDQPELRDDVVDSRYRRIDGAYVIG